MQVNVLKTQLTYRYLLQKEKTGSFVLLGDVQDITFNLNDDKSSFESIKIEGGRTLFPFSTLDKERENIVRFQ